MCTKRGREGKYSGGLNIGVYLNVVLSLGGGPVVCLEVLAGWDPFYPSSLPREAGGPAPAPPTPSLLLGLAGDSAAVWRVHADQLSPKLSLVARCHLSNLDFSTPPPAGTVPAS